MTGVAWPYVAHAGRRGDGGVELLAARFELVGPELPGHAEVKAGSAWSSSTWTRFGETVYQDERGWTAKVRYAGGLGFVRCMVPSGCEVPLSYERVCHARRR